MVLTGGIILIVDDEKDFRESLSDLIRAWDYKTLTASGGKEALETLKVKKVDLILMDIKMPEMSGIECLQLIRQQYPETKVVMMTAFSNEIEKAVNLGAVKVFSKPLVLTKVKETLEEL